MTEYEYLSKLIDLNNELANITAGNVQLYLNTATAYSDLRDSLSLEDAAKIHPARTS